MTQPTGNQTPALQLIDPKKFSIREEAEKHNAGTCAKSNGCFICYQLRKEGPLARRLTQNLIEHTTYTFADYRTKPGDSLMAKVQVDVMRPNGRAPGGALRWTYTLLMQVTKTEKGIDNEGNRACGQADAAVLSSTPRKIEQHKLVEIGSVVETPFGIYVIDWNRYCGSVNEDHLTLIEITAGL